MQKWWGFFSSEAFLLAFLAALRDYGIVVPTNTTGLLMIVVGGIFGWNIPNKANE